ncbi:MAG: hypothetical protein HZB26_00415 [Candidatus Hydrogenedentes bacterium]|nr:hypothetical protein [Candidatus Hydrogenedentota bacterium]
MTLHKKLKAVFSELLAEVERNDHLRTTLNSILEDPKESTESPPQKSARRQPGRFDPMALHRQNPKELPRRLDELTVDELKDIIAENGIDRAKLAMKWKTKDRLIQLIVDTVESRALKGDVFRTPLTERLTDQSADRSG